MASAQQPVLEQTSFPDVNPTPQASGANFGAQVGQATEGLGAKLSDAGDVMAQNVLKWQGLKNEATAQDLNVQFQSDLGKLETQYYGLKGKQQADAYPDFENQVLALRQQYLGRAGNPMVQNMLGGVLGASVGYTLRSAGRQAGAATKDWMIQSAAGHADMLTYQAQQHYNDPNYVATAKQGIKDSIQNYGELQGWSQDTIDLKVLDQYALLDKGIQDAAKSTLNGLSLSDAAAALIGQGTAKPGEVGGQAYRLALVRTELGAGQNDPNNPHQGPVQADDAWWARFGAGGDRNNINDAMAALDRETAVNKPLLEKALGRPVTDADLYLAHQQGEAGAEALLKNPDAPASQSVPLANIESNIPKDAQGNPVADANSITGAQFAALWSKGFTVPAGIAGAPSQASQQAQEAAAVLNPENRQALAKSILQALNAQDSAAREQTNFAQAQAAKAAKDQYDAGLTQAKDIIAANWADPGKNPPLDIAKFSQTPFGKQHPEAVTDLINYSKNLTNKPTDDKAATAQLYRAWLNGTAGVDDFQNAYAPKDGSPGSISHDSLDWLVGLTKGKNDPDAEATKGLKDTFLKNTLKDYFAAGEALKPDSEQRFNVDFETKWGQFVAAGKDPRALVTPGNPDYFGTPANLANYSQTAADQLQEEQDANSPSLLSRIGTAVGDFFGGGNVSRETLPAGLPEGSTYAGTSKTDGAPLYRLPKSAGGGLVRVGNRRAAQPAPAATPAPAEAPVEAGPAVPTGQ